MDLENFCMGCMNEKPHRDDTCNHCGFEESTLPDSPLHLPPRTILQEKYLIGRVIGQGGFGITYLAWDINLRIKLAIKEYFPRDLAVRAAGQSQVSAYTRSIRKQYEYGLDQFLQEAQTLAQFDGHPNIVSVRDYFKSNGTAYFVMSYVEGVTLKEFLDKSGGRLPVDQSRDIIMQVLDALKDIHGFNVLHRDIRPCNISIDQKGRVTLIDFGAARQAASETGHCPSTIPMPGYAPEEQYRVKGTQGPWTDIYSAAATLYHLVTGQPPPESLERLINDALVPPSQSGAALSDSEEQVILKALAVKAADRFRTVEEFQTALTSKRLPVGSAAPAPPEIQKSAGSPTKTKAKASPLRLIVGLAAVIIVVIAVLAFLPDDTTGHRQDAGDKVYTVEELAAIASGAIAYIEAPSAADATWYSMGSGFVIKPDGVIVTNYHVLEGAGSATVEVGGRVYDEVTVIAASEEWDLAILKINARGLTALTLADGIASVSLGQEVLALGNPEGFKGTVSSGIVSAIRQGEELGIELIQTTAPISKGSSGGPLLNMYGEVIGVNTYTYAAGQNLNFAVPVDLVRELLASAGSQERTVAEVFSGGSQAGSEYSAVPGEFTVILRWEENVDLDLEIWTEDFEYLGSAALLGECSDITSGSQGEEWFTFKEYPENILSRNFGSGRYIVSPFYYGPEDAPPTATTLALIYPDGREETILEQVMEFTPPYDQWFAILVDAGKNSYKILDFFFDSDLVALLEWDTGANLDLAVYHYDYDEVFIPSDFGGYDITDGGRGLEIFSFGFQESISGFFDFSHGMVDVFVLMDYPGTPVTEAAVRFLYLAEEGFAFVGFNHTFTADPLGNYGWVVLTELNLETLEYYEPVDDEARVYFD